MIRPLFDANASASWHAKTVTRYPQVDWYFYGSYHRARTPSKPLENGCPMAEMFIPRTREIWNAATCSTYVNCSAKQAAAAPARISQRTVAIYTQITLHDLEQARILYFMLPRLSLQWLFKRESAMVRKNKVYILLKNLCQYFSGWIWTTVSWERIMCGKTIKDK